MAWAIFIPDDEIAPRTIRISDIGEGNTAIRISDKTFKSPGRKTRRSSISDNDEAPRRKKRRRASTEGDMPARHMRFYRALCIVAFVLLEAGALFAAHTLFRDDPKMVVLMAGLYSGLPVCILIIGICCCNPKHAK